MHVHELGAGPAILLLHGAPSPATDLLALGSRLATRFRVLVPELPGYGASPPLEDFSLDRVARALRELLASRDIARLHGMVGFSGGAYRAFHLALRHGIEVDRICGLGSLATLDEASREGFRGFADAIDRDPTAPSGDAFRTIMAERMLSPRWRADHPEDVARVAGWPTLMRPADLAAELRAWAEVDDLRPELPRLSARLYLRVGELDAACPPALSREIAALVSGAHVDVVAGCGHCLLIEDAEPTIAAIERFLST